MPTPPAPTDPPAQTDPPAPTAPPAPDAQTDEQFLTEHGFPRNTKEADMTAEQARAYWRDQSKKQQKDADGFRKIGKSPAEIQKLIDDAETARLAALSEADRALEAAKTEAAAAASNKFLAPAIEGQIVALTRGAGETPEDALTRVKGALKYIDATKFLDANGDLDATEIQTFAQSLAPKDGNGGAPSGDPIADALRRQQVSPIGSGGSVAAMEAEYYARLKPSQQ